MVHVNRKPQHIVFCLHSRHLSSKQRDLAVESSQSPCLAHVSGLKNCPKSDAIENRLARAFNTPQPAVHTVFWDAGEPDPFLTGTRPPIKPRTDPEPAQGAEVVQFAVQACGDVDKEEVCERLSISGNGLRYGPFATDRTVERRVRDHAKKRRPFPGDAFCYLQQSDQSAFVSILIP